VPTAMAWLLGVTATLQLLVPLPLLRAIVRGRAPNASVDGAADTGTEVRPARIAGADARGAPVIAREDEEDDGHESLVAARRRV
jgi:hypothetical protein